MCRFASLFLLRRLKESMSGDARDFNNIETRAVKFFFFLQNKAPNEIHAILIEKLGEHAPLYAIFKNWVAQFKRGDFSTCDAPGPGRHKTVTTPEIIDQIHELIWEASRVSGLGPSFMKIWTRGSSPRSGSRNAWTRIKTVNSASSLSKFGIFSARSK